MAEACLSGKPTTKKRKGDVALSTPNKKEIGEFSSAHILPNDPRIVSYQPVINLEQCDDAINNHTIG